MSKRHKLDAKSVGAPSIRVARGDVEIEDRVEQDATGNVVGRRVGHATGLRRYLARGEITTRMHEAGRRFADDFEISKRDGLGAVDLLHIRGGGDPGAGMIHAAASAIAARRRFDRAVIALGPVYPVIADVVLSFGVPATWALRRGYRSEHGFGFLLLGLDALAAHYELEL